MIKQLTIIAGILILVLLLLLIFNIYKIWVGAVLAVLVVLLIIVNLRSTVIVHPCKFRIKELHLLVDFRDDKGKLVHVTMELLTKPFKGTADRYIDRGLAGTGKINNFKSSRYIDGAWKEINISSYAKEGSQIAITTPLDPPMSAKEWTKRKIEFDSFDCFTEEKESLVYRVDSVTDLCLVTFNFHPRRRPNEIAVAEFIGGIKRKLPTFFPSSTKPELFNWSIKKPHLGADYLFEWTWA